MVLHEQAVILLAEDSEDDVILVRRALARANVLNPLFIVRDGEAAIAYLDGVGKYSNREEYPLPDIMLLDIKMPKIDGYEVLREIRRRPTLKSLRIIVLTSSEEMSDVNKAYELGANSFLVKPLEFENYAALMRTLSAFWLHQSVNPTSTRPLKPKQKNGNSPQTEGPGK
jgi:CheY-like chemotaxis protein